ncbi:MAG: hypothetical protein KME05_12755 [Gloeocapsa sp. UFS-A4-WI-NPMV-4B04]|jgi:hypothetical protein|nr:hypothetical protein [Gloeocapsa sp. UFS-A4-WI-NPMV-4B04]
MTSNDNRKLIIDVLPTVEQVAGTGVSSPATALDIRGGSLQQIVDSAIAEVLGRNFKTSDPKAFRTSLAQAFTPQESDGRTVYVWSPRTYAVQSELGGAISGAQASLYYRATAALNSVLPLLNALTPLDPAADLQNMDAARAIVRTEIVELVNELGVDRGPRFGRVTSLFRRLLGGKGDGTIDGQLKNLAKTFGFDRRRINTVEEEQSYSNYLIILDYVISLNASWETYKAGRVGEEYLGTQLVKLSQALSVVAESVYEVYRIMDSVFLGAAERQTVIIDFNKISWPEGETSPWTQILDQTQPQMKLQEQTPPQMTLEELLSWVLHFATFEGQSLAREGGKLAISQVVKETAEDLANLVKATSYAEIKNSAFKRAGVKASLRDLASQLREVKNLAGQLYPPSLTLL